MANRSRLARIRPAWWALALGLVVAGAVFICSALFAGSFSSYVDVLLTSDRSGLVMESGAKVKLRGVEVGRVAGIQSGSPVKIRLNMYPHQLHFIPANVEARIRATTVFGAKYVDLIYPAAPSAGHLKAGAILHSINVTTEVNTLFENVVALLDRVDPAKLNGIISAVADAVRGRGEDIGTAITAADEVLHAVNPRMATMKQDWRSLRGFSNTFANAAEDIVSILDAASTTSSTVTAHASDLSSLLLNTIGFAQSGTTLLGQSAPKLVTAINSLAPTANLLLKYNPNTPACCAERSGCSTTAATPHWAAATDTRPFSMPL
jgi:phospholipid/cholesterol/gamma-HCH transport system substrate-binding protein